MPHADFVHLTVHTAYSLSEGAIPVKKLVGLCQKNSMPAVAITDSNNLFGALEFSSAMAGAGVQPIIGVRLSITRTDTAQGGYGAARQTRRPEPDPLVLLAQDATGYGNLMKLSSWAYLDTPAGETPQVPWNRVAEHAAGLICLTAGAEGALGRLLAEGQADAAEAWLGQLRTAFEGRLYIELRRHGLPREKRVEPELLNLAYRHDLPLVATNECYFADAEMYDAHDVLLCIAEGKYVGETERRRVTAEHRFKSAADMRKLFADLPEAVDNTLVIARRCAFMAPERKPILPRFASEGETEEEALRRMAHEGLDKRLAADAIEGEKAQSYRARLDFELDVIVKMGFPGYFLIVADFIQWSKAHGIPVGPGRGSGAGSVVAWALTITDLDPLRFGLLFERFLNPERVSMPDFDIDFCQDRRDEVIRYVQQKYGSDNVAQIITFGKLQARAALRDVGRVLQLPLGQVDRICKMVPNNPAKPVTLKEAIEGEPRLQAERDADESVARMMEIALKLEGLYRNASTHAAGVVIGDRPLVELVPLYRDPGADIPATQFSMKYAEAAGLVKFDFLGLKTLTVLDRAVKLIAQGGTQIDLAKIPLQDKRTYEILGRGETVGIFQLESSGMRDVLRQMKPDTFEDIIALVALYRPGPMENIPRFIAVKHGAEQPDYLHEWLEPILRETYGVIIYQEQVMEIAKVLAGYSLGEADLLRRAMGKKIKAEMDAQKDRFITGAVAKGVNADRAAYIFELVERFAGYGFNKSHAAAYALVAWHTAYLKANHPVEFIAASMTLDISNTDKLNVFRQDAQRLGIELRQPDINKSGVEFTVEPGKDGKGAIRYALAAVKNVGATQMAGIVAERQAKGPFRDLFDLASRANPASLNKRILENLAKGGAFDAIDANRHRVFAAAETLIRHASASAQERASSQVSLFGEAVGATVPPPPLPAVDPWTPMDQLAKEFEAIGFYLSAHPLDTYAAAMRRAHIMMYSDLLRGLTGSVQRRQIAGTVIGRQERTSAKGNRFAFVQCSDPSGMFEVTVFSETLTAHREELEPGNSVIFHVDAKLQDEQPRLTVVSIESLEKVAARTAAGLRLYLSDAKPVESVSSLLAKVAKGKGSIIVNLRLDEGQREAEIRLPGGWAVSPTVRQALKAVRGVLDVQDL
jgi:DNA polymerase-3 subunit alpha